MDLVYSKEKPLFVVSLIISLIFWLAVIIGTFGAALVYVLFFFIFYLFVQSAFISYLKGTAVKITEEQFPDLYQRVQACCNKIDLNHVPDAYLLHADGVFNALAARFLGRNFIALYSDVVDALESHPGAVNFYIGHELGHIHRKHLVWAPILFPAGILPLLGAAYSRAREYTCDRYGLACCEKSEDAAIGLGALAAGGRRWRSLNKEKYASQSTATKGFWMSFHELIGDYPWLVKRMAMLNTLPQKQPPRLPGRHPLAWVLALFVPRAGTGGAGAAIVLVAIIGILAAIAIPAYQDYNKKVQAAQSYSTVQDQEAAMVEHYAPEHKGKR
ncbi:MAG: M48 family metallopeptidase [Acidiferrobacterales bacterium]